VKQERQDITDHKAFAEGEPEHLVLAQAKPLPDPFDESLVPQQDRVGFLGLLRFFGFLSHDPMMTSTCFMSPANLFLPGQRSQATASFNARLNAVANA
jgi:hypothetical protein